MSRWRVQLGGERFDLEELPKLFSASAARVVETPEGFFLEAGDFDQCTDAPAVRGRAIELVGSMNGVARLVYSSFRPVGVASVVEEVAAGRHITIEVSDALEMRSKVSALLVSTEDGAPVPSQAVPPVSNDWICIASGDSKVQHILRLLGKPKVNWFDLYKVMEVLESEDGHALLPSAGLSKADVRRFSQTANSMGALADAARHAKASIPAPDDPMTLPDATTMIHRWTRAWLRQRSGGDGA